MRRLRTFVIAGSLALTGAGVARAQSTDSVEHQFASYQQMLSETADGLLAAPVHKNIETATAPVTPAVDNAPVHLNSALSRLQQLRPLLEPILREEGVPTNLAAVVLVESGGQPTALSPKGARGLWQLMPDTARRYGLTVTPERDERLDLVKSTHAAARYLHDLYARFGDWNSALAAYNAGEQLVGNLFRKAHSQQFQAISPQLPNETRSYVPAVLNAAQRFEVSLSPPGEDPSGKVLFAGSDIQLR